MTAHREQHDAGRYLDQLRVSLGVREVGPERAEEFAREVEAHLEASGEDPEEAFGQPWELAEALAAVRPSPLPRDPAGMIALAVAAFVGPWLVLQGAVPLLSGEDAVLTLAHAASMAVGLAAVPAVLPAALAFLDGRRSLRPAIGMFTVAIAAVVGVYVAVPAEVLYEGSGWPVVAAGIAALAATAALIMRRGRQRSGGR
jgi:hypothetical protein